MRTHVALLIAIIGILKLRGVESDELEDLTKKAKSQIEAVNLALKGTTPDEQQIRANAMNLVRKLRYFNSIVEANADKGPNQELADVIKHVNDAANELAPKNTRSVSDVLPAPVTAMESLKKVFLILAKGTLVATGAQIAGRTAKAGLDILSAVSDLAASTLDTMYPTKDNLPKKGTSGNRDISLTVTKNGQDPLNTDVTHVVLDIN